MTRLNERGLYEYGVKLEGNLLEKQESERAVSELIDLLPERFAGLRIQYHNARARKEPEVTAVLRDIVYEFRRWVGDQANAAPLLDAQADKIDELEEQLEDAHLGAEAAADERDEAIQEQDRLEREVDTLKTEKWNLQERVDELEDELRNTIQKAGDNV